ncbi:MAG: copper resistance protein NlpE N-terminal domain-containing protein [Bacteroidota bacterium]
MKTSYTLFLVAIIMFISCGSSQSTYVNPHTEPHKQMHEDYINEENQKAMNENIQKNIYGTFLGMLPCADCEKIIYRLQLKEDKTYHSRITYQGKSDKPIEETGTFSYSRNGIIFLNEAPEGMNKFKFKSKGLLMLDTRGKEITGDLADQYYLLPAARTKGSPRQDRYQQIMYKKWEEGIDFYAIGNEPFWKLDMNLDNNIHFNKAMELDFIAPPVEPEIAMDANVIRYRSVSEEGEIIVQISKTKCTDSMSGKEFSHNVTVDLKTNEDTDYQTYKGCGNYVPDPRLNDIWAIKEVDGIEIKPEDFVREFPRFEINLTEQKVYGHDGCNNFNGSITSEAGKIIFGNLAGTMKACIHNAEISNKISRGLSGKTFSYKIENNQLILFDKNKTMMILQHID